ncbi:hypothetical protein [Streptomyces swartbergensis]|uniref:hypothetical protein n=1 Tax=Streptomyces swartbergensis TaxID=487165 RepID=UPI0037FDC1BC
MSPLLVHPKTARPPRRAPTLDAEPASGRRRRRVPTGVRWVVALLVVVVSVVVAVSVPVVRQELRQSFSPVPSQYTELYFTRPPAIERTTAVVPVSVVGHGAEERTYRLRVWLESPAGRVLESTTTTLTSRPDEPEPTVVRLPLRQDPVVVHVALLGHDPSLHFRLGADSAPAPEGPP